MVSYINEILIYSIGNNLVKDYLFALGILVLSIIVLRIVKKIIIFRLKKLTEKTKTELDDLIIKIIEDIGWPAYLVVSLFVAIQFIKVPAFSETGLFYTIIIAATFYAVKSIQKLIDYGTKKIVAKRRKEEKDADTTVIDFLSRLLKWSLWIIAALLILSNLGYNVSTLIAGLGIGGIAIALALQNILSDIFASFSIYFDKPFQVGDFIIVGDDMGIVKKVGIKTTRLQTLQGEELVISNRELTETRVHNFKRMERRRISFTFGVTYQTPTKKLRKIPKIVRDTIEKIELADVDRVHFKHFGDFSLNFEVVYYVNTSDYAKYMDIQQEINLTLKEKFEKEGIEFAYPTQTILCRQAT